MLGDKLDGVALVTGAASGIGQSCAYAFAAYGASVVVFADRNLDGAEKSAEKSKEYSKDPAYRAVALQVEITDPVSVDSMVSNVVKEFSRIDYFVNSAGVDPKSYAHFNESELQDYKRVMDINAQGTFLSNQAVARVMKDQDIKTVTTPFGTREVGRGAIVNISSACGLAAVPGKVGYVGSKFAMLGINKSAALDNSEHKIRVNAICPSWVRTPMYDIEVSKAPEVEGFIKSAIGMGRPAEAVEIAESAMFLCSPAASYISGISLLVDAGLCLTIHVP